MSMALSDSNSSPFPRPPPLNIVGGASGNLGFEFVYNWTVVNNDAQAQTLTVTDRNGTPTVLSVPANTNQTFRKVPTVTYSLSGVAVGASAAWPTEPNPSSVVVPAPTNVVIAGDSVGLARSAQFPSSLDGGNLKIAIEKPLNSPSGSVDVHDTGS